MKQACIRCGGKLAVGVKFCSHPCYLAYTKERAIINRKRCERCGEPVHTKGMQVRFCSKVCAHAASRGRTLPTEQRAKIAESNRQTKNAPPDDTRTCEACGASFCCRPHSTRRFCCHKCCFTKRPRRTMESRRALSERYKGEGNPAWKGGVTPASQRDRQSIEYTEWRKAVYWRDQYCCVDCGVRGCRRHPIVAHHVVPWAESIDLRFTVSNGVTLCQPCHRVRHGWPVVAAA